MTFNREDLSMKNGYNEKQLEELLYQALETEIGGIEVYRQAVLTAMNDDLRDEWEDYHEETKNHHKVLLRVFEELGLDPEMQTPGRKIVAQNGNALVAAIRRARESGDRAGAELVAAECVVLAETKDHLNWHLIGHIAEHGKGVATRILRKAYEEVEDEEDHHLYHTKGWCRELWIDALGMPAVLPPPEEVKSVETAIGASRAEHARDQMM
jgi:hypothetical protein